jgi:ATP synthase subunit 6
MYSPLEQYKIIPLIHFGVGNYDISFTNSSLNCLLIIICYYLLFKYNTNRLIPSNYQLLLENTYTFLLNPTPDMIGVEGKKYFNLIFTIFLFILTSNLLGMIPYNLTITSHIIITFGLSFSLWFAITLIGILKHGYKLVFLFKPEGTSGALLLLIMPIEFISYLTRPLSLGIRLTANMFAGHTLLNIIAWFTWQILTMGGILSILGTIPIALIILLIVLELLICFLQSYVFTVLIISYLNDVIHLH